MNLIETIYRNAQAHNVKITLPCDHICGKDFLDTTESQRLIV